MKLRLFVSFIIILFPQVIFASNIDVATFDELIQSGTQSVSGDTITITDNLTSDSSIGNSFYTKDVSFLGQNHGIDGKDIFGGFVLSQGSAFDSLRILNCKGQIYNNSYFAGAIFNTTGTTLVNNSAFSGNYADAQGFNFSVGGALYNFANGRFDISSSLFDNNYAHGASAQGGAIGNEAGSNIVNIADSVFNSNYTSGSAISYGGAIYNGSGATMSIKNSLFNNNYSEATASDAYLYGGSIYNTGNMNIDNSYFSNNHIIGSTNSFSYGGAIHNSSNLTITNSTFDSNYINSDIDTSGGALYNYQNGNIIIENSTFKNNYIDAQNSRGGAIGNEGIITIINSTFENNKDTDGLNDIFSNNTINFDGSGTTNILSGIRGSGNINKNDSGVLNLGGNNSRYSGNFSLNDGTVNLLAGSSYFNAAETSFSNGVNFNMQNGQIDGVNFGSMTLSGQSNIYPDVNLYTNTMDTISASSLSGSGNIYVPNLAIEGVPQASFISIPFADEILKNSVSYQSKIINTPIYNYLSYYDSSSGNFDFSRQGFYQGVFAPAVAAQAAGYLLQIDTLNNVFSNLDMVMIMEKNKKISLDFKDKLAYGGQNQFIYSPLAIPEQRSGIWFKPYSVFENIPLKGGPKVSNVGYGGLIGGESGLIDIKRGWKFLYGGYASYNGSHQAYDGIGIYNNGGLVGLDAAFYKGNFFTLWSANVGANCAKTHTDFGSDNFTMLNTSVAQKSGFNFEFFDNKFIFQPSVMTSYAFVNTFDYTSSSGVYMDSKPLNAIHIEPQIKLIGNFKNYLQPYFAVSFAWNIIDDTRFSANDVYLPELSVKPYVRYGLGVQKRIGDTFSGFFQTYITSGGRNGIGLQAGFRWALGREKKYEQNNPREGSLPQKPKPKIVLNNIKPLEF